MIRVDPQHWTADFRIARGLAEAYAASGLSDVFFFCVGDPDDPIDALGPLIGDETAKYFPGVLGTSQSPVTRDNVAERVKELAEAAPGAFVIGVETGAGLSAHLGSIEITDRDLSVAAASGGRIADVTVSVVLRVDETWERRAAAPRSTGLAEAIKEIGTDEEASAYGREKKFTPLRPDQVNAAVVRRLADTVIDGHLRLLSKIGKQRL